MNTYNEQEKILRVNLRLQMSLAIRVDQTELEWEVTASSPKEQTIELLTNYLKRQKYFTSTGKIFSLKTRYSLGEKEESKQEIKILKNPLQTRILEDPLAKKSVRQEYLNLNLLLEAYQTKEASFDTILNVSLI
jgi:hypothetical protein